MRCVRKLFLFIGLSACFFMPHAVCADDVDRDGAYRLQKIFEDLIENQKGVLVPNLGITLLYDGRVNVGLEQQYYAVTLPHIKALYPDGRVFELGMISVNAVPGKVQGRWTMTIALPMPMVMLDKKNQIVLRIDTAEQSAIGIWDERLGGFLKFQGNYKGVHIDGVTRDFTAQIPTVTAQYDFSEGALKIDAGSAVLELILGSLLNN